MTYKTFSSFLTGQVCRGLILGSMFVIAMTLLRLPYALLTGIVIAFTALIPIFGAFIGCAVGAFLIFMVSPVQALIFIVLFLVLQQIEGESDLSACGGQFGRPSVYLGAGCGKYRRKPDGYRWNVDFYSADVSVLCFVPGSCLH